MTWQSGRVEVSNGYLAYHRTGGSNPALVLSHGLTDNGLCWSRVAQALESDFDLIMLDARDHGDSSKSLHGASADPAKDILEAVDGLKLDAPLLMGHSVGARAVATFANTFPDRALRVILEDPSFVAPVDESAQARRQQAFRRQIDRFKSMTEPEILALGKSQHPTWREDEFPAWIASKKQVSANAMAHFQLAPWQQTIDSITAPTLLVYGDQGGIVTREIAETAQSINSNIVSIQIEGAGHNIRREKFNAFLAAIRAFLP